MTNSTTETINLEQLATVTGGTAAETAELKNAILGNPELAAIWERKSERYGADDEQTCHMVLMEAFGVINANCSSTKANDYRIMGRGDVVQRISHADMVYYCKNYKSTF